MKPILKIDTSSILVTADRKTDMQLVSKLICNHFNITEEELHNNYIFASVTLTVLDELETINYEYITIIPLMMESLSVSVYNCYINQLIINVKQQFIVDNPNEPIESILDMDMHFIYYSFNPTTTSNTTNKKHRLNRLHNQYKETYLL